MIAHWIGRWRPLPFLVGLALGGAVLVGGGFAQYRAELHAFNDFSTVWAAARTQAEGGDPYRRDDWYAAVRRYPVQANIEPFFTYPPYVTFALVPLGVLPLEVAFDVWTYGGMLLGAAALYALLATAAPGRPVVHTLAGASLLASQPGVATYWSGQWAFVLVAAAALAALAALRGGRWRTVATAALYAKPHLFAFALWAIAAAHARARRWRELALLVLVPFAIAIPAMLARPLWLEEMLRDRGQTRFAAAHVPSTLAHALDDVGAPGALLAAILLVLAVVVATRFDPRSPEGLAVWTSLSISFAPYIWSYDHLILIVPLVLATARRSDRFAAVVFGGFLLIPTLLYAVATVRDNESFSVLVPLAVMGLCAASAIVPTPRPRTTPT